MKRLTWEHDPHGDNGCYAYNDDGDRLGVLKFERVGQWMHWCWYQFEDIRMSPGCLQEVRDKQKELKNNNY